MDFLSLFRRHLEKLKNSIHKKLLITIVTVNEYFEVIDGHHRLTIFKELKLPVRYIIYPGYTLKEVHIFNQVSKTWSIDDYVVGYSAMNNENYIKYKEFRDKYNFGPTITLNLLCNAAFSWTNNQLRESFKNGTFKIVDYEKAINNAEKLIMISKYFAYIKGSSFIAAMLHLFKKDCFDFDTFIKKLELQPTALKLCGNKIQYLELIESIYNYKSHNKVNLRF